MASSQWKSNSDLKAALAEEGHRFQFFSAVQALHRLKTGNVAVGELGPIAEEPVRFRHSTSLIFHAGDIEGVELKEGRAAVVTSTFLGLYGSASPLGPHFSEQVIDAEQEEQPTLRAFYDIFHHRLISLYYRAWKKYRLQAGFTLESEDTSIKRMLCMVGVDGYGGSAQSGLSRLEQLELAPLLAMRARPPRVLALALERLLPGASVQIEQFIERRASLEAEDRMLLGRQSNCLGRNATLGARIRDRSARFRVIMGPMDYSACEELMPGGSKYPVLRRVIEQFTRGTLECEVDVLLQKDQTPGYCLGGERGARLGVSTRLGDGKDGALSRMRVLLTDDTQEARAILIDATAA